jgi:hypothetical protein
MSVITEMEMILLVDTIKKACVSREDTAKCYDLANDIVADWIVKNKIQIL